MILSKEQLDSLVDQLSAYHDAGTEVLERAMELRKAFSDLPDEGTALMLYLLDSGMMAPFGTLMDVDASETFSTLFEVTFRGAVMESMDPSGKIGATLTMEVRDNSGSLPLSLFREDHIHFFEQLEMVGTQHIIAINIIKRNTRSGLVLRALDGSVFFPFAGSNFVTRGHLDRLEEKQFNAMSEILEDVSLSFDLSVVGTVTRVQALRTFKRKDSSEGAILKLELFDGTGLMWMVFWDTMARSLSDIGEGEGLEISGAFRKPGESDTLYTNSRTRINRS